MVIDIDHFKKFNDTYGHQKGDEVLEGVAGFIRSAIRTTDIACRYGGEELAVILPNTDIVKAAKVAEKIRRKVASLSKEQFGIRVTISLGVAEITRQIKTAVHLIKAADRSLYQAKKSGRNRTCAA
jgi:diguanylate cyclase (GGDEF)-like protein